MTRRTYEGTVAEPEAPLEAAPRPVPMTPPLDLVGTLPGIVWVADGTDYRMAFVSPRARDILGLDPAAWAGEPDFWERHLHPDDRDEAIAAVEAALDTMRAGTCEYRFLDGDGGWRHIRDTFQVLERGDGHREIVGFMQDISAEAADREVAARLAAIVRSAADACYANAPDGTYLAWNEAASRIYGWTREEVMGRRVYDLVAEEEHPRIRAWLARAGAGETLGPVDMIHRGRDGRAVTLSVVAAPVVDRTGRVASVATIARDVSIERRLAAERRSLENELLQAQKLEAVGRLAGGIAHDFNNMLTAISGYASLMAASLEGPHLADLRQIQHAAERAADLTRRLMAFSRPQALDPRPVDVDAVLADAYGMVRRLVPERVVLTIDTGAGCSVLADPVEIEQVLLNLVVNAVDAIEGAGEIVVRTRREQAPDRGSGHVAREVLQLTVSDTGSGMDPDTQARIFEPFFTTKDVGAGTGLGLATVHAIVRRAGGTIAVVTNPGRGTTFVIEMPIVRPTSAPVPRPVAPVRRGTERVLVVDDSEVVRVLTARMLELAGYEVSVAAAPFEVLERGVDDLDAIVTDVVMPGMSGPELVAALDLRIPVVFMSGYTADHDPGALRIGPRRTFIHKPFDQDDLLTALRAVLDEAGARTA
jgi:PAS domain S-box-containing protein